MPNPTRRTAFTLLELMVSVSVIGLLVALLMPIAGMMRNSAKAVSCMSSLRQWGMAAMSYAGDNRGTIIGADTYVDGIVREWPEFYRPYTVVPDASSSAGPRTRCTRNTAGLYGLYWNPIRWYAGQTSDGPAFREAFYPNAAAPMGPGTAQYYGMWKLSAISWPTDFLIMGCSSAGNGAPGYAPITDGGLHINPGIPDSGGYTNQRTAWLAHRDRGNAVFADGHVEACNGDRMLTMSNARYLADPRKSGIRVYKLQDGTLVQVPDP